MSDTWISFNGNALSLNGYGLVVSGQNPYNPLNLPAYTVRFQFDDSSYDPTQVSGWKAGSAWTRVSTSPNIWDYYTGTVHGSISAYTSTFENKFNDNANTVHVLGAYLPPLSKTFPNDGSNFFASCTALISTSIVDFSGFKVLSGTFKGCANLSTLDTIYVINATGFSQAFRGCTSLTTSPYIVAGNNLLGLSNMFENCTSLSQVTVFDTSSATTFSGMFSYCSSLQTAPSLNTSSATTFDSMFLRCTGLSSVPAYDISNATSARLMFSNCTSLTTSPIFNTGKVTNFEAMYSGCQSLTTVPLFNTANATDVDNMFGGCYSVQSGALALYNQMNSQAFPPSSHSGCFSNCGRDSVSGAQELAQIPQDWGGTMA